MIFSPAFKASKNQQNRQENVNWYVRWHQHPWVPIVHWGILLVAVMIIFSVLIIVSLPPEVVTLSQAEGPNYAPDRVLVKLKKGVSADGAFLEKYHLTTADRLLAQFHPRGPAKQHLENVGLDRLYLAKIGNGMDPKNVASLLQKDTQRVDYAEPDFMVTGEAVPNDPSFGVLWGMHNTGQSGGLVDADVDAPEAWDTAQNAGSIVVAVVDSGIDASHPDLSGNIWTNGGEVSGNGVDDDGNGFVDDVHGYDFVNNDSDPLDDNGHGTHVSGTLGAVGNNGIGVAGITWDVQIMPVKFLDASNNGFTSNAIKGLNYALQMGAVTSNHSWGGASFSQALFDAISSARSQGHLVVAAAGNGGADSDATPFYPASYDLDNIIAVAATDRYDNLTNFSNYGATRVDLAAPGYSIYSTLPNNSYGYKSGTSMATPHVTGAAALLWQRDRSLTYSTIKSLLMSRSDALSSLQGKVVSGGRLNLASLLGTGSPTPTPSPAPSPSPSPVSSPSPTPSPSSTPTPTPEPDSIPPTVIITNPSAGAVLPKVGTVAFTAAASDNKGVSEMQLFVDGVKNKTCTGVTTCSTNLSMKKLASGSHILKAVAIDTGSPANTSDVFNTVTKP